jgi:hypothetical protein
LDGQIDVSLRFMGEPVEDMKTALDRLGATKIEAPPRLGVTGIETVLVCSLLAGQIAQLVYWIATTWRSGMVVVVSKDGKSISTEKNSDLPPGSVLLIHTDGTSATLHKPSQLQLGSWFKGAMEAIKG